MDQFGSVTHQSVKKYSTLNRQTGKWNLFRCFRKVQTIEEYIPFLEDIFRETNELKEDAQEYYLGRAHHK